MASHGADQLIVQRLLSSRSLKDAQRALIGSGIVVFAQFTLFLMVGLGLFAFYHGRVFPTSDAIFPTFILEEMPSGLIGLIIAAILAATMSTHSGAINSLAAATTHDIYLPLSKRSADDAATLRFGKLSALGLGRRPHWRCTALQAARDSRSRDSSFDRVVYLRRAAWRLFPRLAVATGNPA
jgi:Na+/proline symporter